MDEISDMPSSEKNSIDGEGSGDGNVRSQDAKLLSSLSEAELKEGNQELQAGVSSSLPNDLLISLKELAIRCATNIGHKHLCENFDVKMLCAHGFIMVEYFKECAKSTLDPNLAGISTMFNSYSLSNLNSENSVSYSKSSMKDTDPLNFVNQRRKRMWEGLCEETVPHHKRHKTSKPEI